MRIKNLLTEELLDLSKWWEYSPNKVMQFVYWTQNQLPPSDPKKRAEAWKHLLPQLQKKYPKPPIGDDSEAMDKMAGDVYETTGNDAKLVEANPSPRDIYKKANIYKKKEPNEPHDHIWVVDENYENYVECKICNAFFDLLEYIEEPDIQRIFSEVYNETHNIENIERTKMDIPDETSQAEIDAFTKE